MLDFPDNAAEICRAFNNLSFNYGDLFLTYQYGLYNADFPAPIRKRNFVLDFDAYCQGPQNFDDIRRNIDLFHDKIQDLFERSITDKLRNKMGINTDG